MIKKAIFIILLLKILSLGIYEVYDSTEGRYASIAMRMAQNNNFVTPFFLPDVPFLAKPPLAFWVSAISIKIFGYNEFAVRLPHFLIMLLAVYYGFYFLKTTVSDKTGLYFVLMVIVTPAFWLLAGSVMTDGILTAGMLITNLSYFFIISSRYNIKNSAIFWFFLGLLLCVLSKGVIGVLLCGASCFLYTLIKNKWKELPLFKLFLGFITLLIFILPWFYLMQVQNPEFLNYFFIGEHFERFTISNWQGDKYGYAHSQPIGTIFLFFLLLIFPIGFYLIYLCFKERKPLKEHQLFLLICAVIPLLFFTFSRNIIIPYAGLSVPPFIMFCISFAFNIKEKSITVNSILTGIVMFLSALFSFKFSYTDKALIKEFQILSNQKVLYYITNPDYSSYFYTKDNIKKISFNELKQGEYFISSVNFYKNPIICNNSRCLYKR